ncbi:hypothetical protein WJX74_006191 [Apatococcus lobatus]|uniref:Uncharacterized protein n=1 Tax=Apatococcus lobatus TaxID=904363 RepID=A0AAW1SFE8_9CHLO
MLLEHLLNLELPPGCTPLPGFQRAELQVGGVARGLASVSAGTSVPDMTQPRGIRVIWDHPALTFVPMPKTPEGSLPTQGLTLDEGALDDRLCIHQLGDSLAVSTFVTVWKTAFGGSEMAESPDDYLRAQQTFRVLTGTDWYVPPPAVPSRPIYLLNHAVCDRGGQLVLLHPLSSQENPLPMVYAAARALSGARFGVVSMSEVSELDDSSLDLVHTHLRALQGEDVPGFERRSVPGGLVSVRVGFPVFPGTPGPVAPLPVVPVSLVQPHSATEQTVGGVMVRGARPTNWLEARQRIFELCEYDEAAHRREDLQRKRNDFVASARQRGRGFR